MRIGFVRSCPNCGGLNIKKIKRSPNISYQCSKCDHLFSGFKLFWFIRVAW